MAAPDGPSKPSALAAMKTGSVLVGYFENRGGQPIRHPLFVYFRESTVPGELGCLYWCLPTKRVESPERCLQLSQISEMYLGKHSSVFRMPIAKNAPADRCFSIINKDKTHLNFEAESHEQAQ